MTDPIKKKAGKASQIIYLSFLAENKSQVNSEYLINMPVQLEYFFNREKLHNIAFKNLFNDSTYWQATRSYILTYIFVTVTT